MKLTKIDIASTAPGKTRATVLIIYTGGTFGMVYDVNGVLIPFDFASIPNHLPAIKTLSIDITVIAFDTPIDSSDIEPTHWKLIADIIAQNYGQYDGFVVLHGTDTMAFTASALSFMLEGLNKPVILTGAQLPISEPRSDARENLITALEIATAQTNGAAVVPEVCIYFDYELLRGNRAKKAESMQFDAFDSDNYPPLAKAGVKITYDFSAIRPVPKTKTLTLRSALDTNVLILKLFPGIRREIVQALLATPGLRAAVLETYGSGNAPTAGWFSEELKNAIDRNILVLNISQCPGGMVTQGKYETSKKLLEIGVIGGADMTTEAAITKLMVLLGEHTTQKVKELIAVPLAGEMRIV